MRIETERGSKRGIQRGFRMSALDSERDIIIVSPTSFPVVGSVVTTLKGYPRPRGLQDVVSLLTL